jgi:hypothetical protein
MYVCTYCFIDFIMHTYQSFLSTCRIKYLFYSERNVGDCSQNFLLYKEYKKGKAISVTGRGEPIGL